VKQTKELKPAEEIQAYYIGADGKSIYELLKQYDLNWYRQQAILYLVRAGKKEGFTELDDLTSAMRFIQGDIERKQESQNQAATKPPRKPRRKRTEATPQPQPEAVSA